MTREKMPARRTGIGCTATHRDALGNELTLHITANVNENGVREVFCANPMEGSDLYALLTDGCILISLLLQYGYPIKELADDLGERRAEGAKSGAPASALGTIARVASLINAELKKEDHGGET